jgi:predicted kinase
MTVGSDQTRLIVLRGNSGAGKSTVARRCARLTAEEWPGSHRISFDGSS